MFLQRLQALLLRLSVEMHPELEDQRTVVGERALERRDAREPPVERARPDAPVGAVQQRRGIPGAEEEAEPPPRRQVAPIAPELGPLPFFLGEPVVGVSDDAARVEPFREQIDRLSLPAPSTPANSTMTGKSASASARCASTSAILSAAACSSNAALEISRTRSRSTSSNTRALIVVSAEVHLPTRVRHVPAARTAAFSVLRPLHAISNGSMPTPPIRQGFPLSRGYPPSARRAAHRGPAGGRGRRASSGGPRTPGGGPAPR